MVRKAKGGTSKYPGVSPYRGDRFEAYISNPATGKKQHLGYFDTFEEAKAARIEAEQANPQAVKGKRSKDRAQRFALKAVAQLAPDNSAVERALSPVAFRDLLSFVEKGSGLIDTSPGSEFDIWCQAAEIAEVSLKPASEFFSWLGEVVFDANTAQLALASPGPLVSALRKVEASKVPLKQVNEVLRVVAMQRRRLKLDQVLKIAKEVPDYV